MKTLKRWWARIVRWWVDPFPASFQETEREGQRRIPIEIGFQLAADGKVYWHRRRDDGVRRVDNPEIVAMVHTEYRELVKQARRTARFRRLLK